MKKLLSLSILAATLASTAAFADPLGTDGSSPSVNPNVSERDVFLVQKNNAAPNVLVIAGIAQNAIDQSTPGNTILKANFVLDQKQNLKTGLLVLAKALQPSDNDAIQAAIVSGIREAIGSNGAGWKFVKFEAGQGSGNIGVVYFIDGRQGNDLVRGIEIKSQRNQVTFAQVKVAQTIAAELKDNKNKTLLTVAGG